MLGKKFFKEEYGGALSTEMVVLIAVICILLPLAVGILYTGMRDYFTTWAGFFSGGGGGG